MPSEIEPRSNRSSYRSRRNPFSMDATKRVVMSSTTAGVSTAVTFFALKFGLQKLNEKMTANPITGYKAALAKGVTGVGVALIADAYLPEAAAPIAAGIGVGGVASAIIDAVDTYRATPAAPAPPANPAHPPAGYPYGLPQQQQQMPAYGVPQPQYQYGPTR